MKEGKVTGPGSPGPRGAAPGTSYHLQLQLPEKLTFILQRNNQSAKMQLEATDKKILTKYFEPVLPSNIYRLTTHGFL